MIHNRYNYSDNPGTSDDIKSNTDTYVELQPDLAELK